MRVLLYPLWGFLLGVALFGVQDKPKTPPFIPNEVQKLKLENAQLRAGIAQRDLTAAQRAWNEMAAAFQSTCKEIKTENNWPEDLTCDLQSLQFTEPVSKSVPPPNKKP